MYSRPNVNLNNKEQAVEALVNNAIKRGNEWSKSKLWPSMRTIGHPDKMRQGRAL